MRLENGLSNWGGGSPERNITVCSVAFFAIALLVGGGGSPAPAPELFLQLLTCAIALWLLLTYGTGNVQRGVPKSAWFLSSSILLLPVLQLIPLPPFVWQALPGRDLEIQALSLVGGGNDWRSWSMSPSRTLASLLALLPPILMFLMASALGWQARTKLMIALLVVVAAMLVVGTLQLTAGADNLVRFYGSSEQWLFGFQANHNSAADVLLMAMASSPLVIAHLAREGVVRDRPAHVLVIAGLVFSVLSLGVVLTASRAGMFLLPIPLAANLWILRTWVHLSPRFLALVAVGVLAIALLGLMLIIYNPTVSSVMGRFDFGAERRPLLWFQSLHLALKYFPAGVGLGNFVPAYIADEQLEAIRPLLPNRAHNDFLELACEAGLPGLLILVTVSLVLVRAFWQQMRSPSAEVSSWAAFSGAGLAILALHSLVDYPFRSMSLACLGAVCAGLLLNASRPNERSAEPDRPNRKSQGPGRTWASALVVGFMILAIGSGADRLSATRPVLAANIPELFASEALRILADKALTSRNASAAARLGRLAILDAPTDPQSAAILGAAELALSKPHEAERAFRIAGQLGWRVPITQAYWLDQALMQGRYDIAALRLDAILRQQPEALRQRALTDPIERNPAGVSALIARMKFAPVWLEHYAGDVSTIPIDVVLQRASVLEEAAQNGVALGCNRISPIANRLAASKQAAQGAVLWRLHCPAAGNGLVSDERFEMLSLAPHPSAFAWQLAGDAKLTVMMVPKETGPGSRLEIEGDFLRPQPFLSQLVVLEEGDLTLSWKSGGSRGQKGRYVAASISCPGETPIWLPAEFDAEQRLWRAKLVVDDRCDAQLLTIAALPESGRFWLDEVAISK